MTPNPDLEVVTVLECHSPPELALAKATLEEAGIPYYVDGESVGERLEMLSPFSYPRKRIAVASDREAEARALLEPLKDIDSAGEAIG
ncbi:MAG TPA: DUF2007 domain-containing protein [Bryobacteraceae bacterium]|nr:DUF2007 domain-containing protein [Bryobacteraceae bacterium]